MLFDLDGFRLRVFTILGRLAVSRTAMPGVSLRWRARGMGEVVSVAMHDHVAAIQITTCLGMRYHFK